MNQDEVREIVQHVQLVAQKLRSNVREIADDPDNEEILAILAPEVFGRVNAFDISMKLLAKEHISGGDLYNLMWKVHASEAMMAMYEITYTDWPVPEPDPSWITQVK